MNKKMIYSVAIGDISAEEYKKLGHYKYGEKIGAVKIAEFRCPKRGEWFISGAIPQAYKAPNDLSTPYHIAKLVKYRKVIRYEIVE